MKMTLPTITKRALVILHLCRTLCPGKREIIIYQGVRETAYSNVEMRRLHPSGNTTHHNYS